MGKIAVVGAGFCGLASTYYLLQYGHRVDLFDGQAIGENTSSSASGLCHPFPGFLARIAKYEKEGMKHTHQLVSEAQKMSKTPLITHHGLLRVAMNERQKKRYDELVNLRDDVCSIEPPPHVREGLATYYISSGFAVDCHGYIVALYQRCLSLGLHFEKQKIDHKEALSGYDHIVIAQGAAAKQLISFDNQGFERVKGQVLVGQFNPPKCVVPTIGSGYLATSKTHIHLGSTYEHDFAFDAPDMEEAKRLILPKAANYLRAIDQFKVEGVRSGVRFGKKHDPLPLFERVDEKTTLLTGMGSRGLLYHALYGQKLAHSINTLLHRSA